MVLHMKSMADIVTCEVREAVYVALLFETSNWCTKFLMRCVSSAVLQ